MPICSNGKDKENCELLENDDAVNVILDKKEFYKSFFDSDSSSISTDGNSANSESVNTDDTCVGDHKIITYLANNFNGIEKNIVNFIFFRNTENQTILFTSVRNPSLFKLTGIMVKLFNVNQRDYSMSTPIFYALKVQNNLRNIRCLIRNGANLNIVNVNGETPIELMFSNYPSLFNDFIKHGADFNKITPRSYYQAILKHDNWEKILDELAPVLDEKMLSRRNVTIMHELAQHPQGYRMMHLFPTLVNKPDINGIYPIMIAVVKQNIDNIIKLISLGADCRVQNCRKISVMEYGIRTRNLQIVSLLVPCVNFNMVNNTGENLLQISCKQPNFNITKLFVSLKNFQGDNPLAISCVRGNWENIKVLKKYTSGFKKNNTLLIDIVKRIFRLTGSLKVTNNRKIVEEKIDNLEKTIKILLVDKIIVDTNLHKLFKYRRFEEIKILVNKKNIDRVDKNGNTLMHLCCSDEFKDLFNYLTLKGANYKIKNNLGLSPMDIKRTSRNELRNSTH